jgi:hypothetical protein
MAIRLGLGQSKEQRRAFFEMRGQSLNDAAMQFGGPLDLNFETIQQFKENSVELKRDDAEIAENRKAAIKALFAKYTQLIVVFAVVIAIFLAVFLFADDIPFILYLFLGVITICLAIAVITDAVEKFKLFSRGICIRAKVYAYDVRRGNDISDQYNGINTAESNNADSYGRYYFYHARGYNPVADDVYEFVSDGIMKDKITCLEYLGEYVDIYIDKKHGEIFYVNMAMLDK